MWSDNDIDNAFRRLDPPEPHPAPFPLDGWLRLEAQLDKQLIEHAVRRKLWQFFAAEVAALALAVVAWLLLSSRPALTPADTAAAKPRESLAQHITASFAEAASEIGTTKNTAPAPAPRAAATRLRASTPATPLPTGRPASRGQTLRVAPSAGRYKAGRANRQAAAAQVSGVVATPSRGEPPTALDSTLGTDPAPRTVGQSRAHPFQKAAEAALIKPTAYEPVARLLADARRETGANGRSVRHRPEPGGAATAADAAPLALVPATVGGPMDNPDALAAALPLAYRPVALALTALPAPMASLPTVAVAEVSNPPVAPALARTPRFYVGVVAGPDLTTVKFAELMSPLPNLGVTVDYRFTNRLRLTTGLLRATKHYAAKRDDYDWGAYRARAYQKDFDEVYGTCTVLDVPLNLRYDALIQPQYRIFGSVGLSSFFMQREQYSYSYKVNNQDVLWERSVVNENRHLLGIVNVSFGYERSLNSHWSIQAEPYVKVPLGGVGLGKVQLVSGGVFFGAKYGL
ncbi:outer membrane beta-barrel protein [Hymenobacter sp. BT664]|uniref:Outer membrane beta-barrel protein n=1 Tax=Hymenobacter montanus TaxID=2771359 RepID=A0A927BBL4_9BACT|nr:outer membrane beta-barrel protein [Hymenobacter montanus]MBD2767102.1 outer membrane beta-barrel protein [Hymenobacter montanus]